MRAGAGQLVRRALDSTCGSNLPLRATRCRIIMVLLLAMLMLHARVFRKSSGQCLGTVAQNSKILPARGAHGSSIQFPRARAVSQL